MPVGFLDVGLIFRVLVFPRRARVETPLALAAAHG